MNLKLDALRVGVRIFSGTRNVTLHKVDSEVPQLKPILACIWRTSVASGLCADL